MFGNFNLANVIAADQANALGGALANVQFTEYNSLRNDGDGNLVVTVRGQVLKKAKEIYVVIAGFGGADFQQNRRTMWLRPWHKGQEATPPDCFSEDGEAPHPNAPAPQSTSCRTCAFGKKQQNNSDAKSCAYNKDVLVYLVEPNPAGGMTIVLDTPLVWRASALSLFSEFDANQGAGGLNGMMSVLKKHGVQTVERIVFGIGFYNTNKAPTLKPVGQVPTDDEVVRITQAAQTPEAKLLMEYKPPVRAAGGGAPALAAPPAAPQLAAPAVVTPPPVVNAFQAAAAVAPQFAQAQAAPLVAPPPVAIVTPPAPFGLPSASPQTIQQVAPQQPVVMAMAAPQAQQAAARSLPQIMMEINAATAAGDMAKVQQLMAEYQHGMAAHGMTQVAQHVVAPPVQQPQTVQPVLQQFAPPQVVRPAGVVPQPVAGPVAQAAPAGNVNAALAAFAGMAGGR